MSVFVFDNRSSYAKMPNTHLRDPSLSLQAKGLLSQLMNFPPGWKVTLDGLCKVNSNGMSSIRSAIKELEKHGYLVVSRQRNADGTLGASRYEIHPEPIVNNITHPSLGFPNMDKPSMDTPPVDNVRLLNNIYNNNIIINKSINKQTNPLNPPEGDAGGCVDDLCEHSIKERLYYNDLCKTHDSCLVDGIVNVMCDTLNSLVEPVEILGMKVSAHKIKEMLLQVDYFAIEELLTYIETEKPQVTNYRKYVIACLYNIVGTQTSRNAIDVLATFG